VAPKSFARLLCVFFLLYSFIEKLLKKVSLTVIFSGGYVDKDSGKYYWLA
jgi:hypothetical protein